MWEFKDIFRTPGSNLSHTHLFEHRIQLKPDEVGFKRGPYRCNPVIIQQIDLQISDMIQNNIIRKCRSNFCFSVVLLVPKGDSKEYRFVVDYRQLNKISVRDEFPQPSCQQLFDTLSPQVGSLTTGINDTQCVKPPNRGKQERTLKQGESPINGTSQNDSHPLAGGGYKYFSIMDLEKGYYQIPMHADSIYLTAFIITSGIYEYLRCPFRLHSGGASLNRTLTILFNDIMNKMLIIYLDDLVCYSSTFRNHLDRLREIFTRLRYAQLMVKPTKCYFLKKEIKFVGHLVSEKGIATLPSTVSAVLDFPRPHDVKTLRSWCGMVGYYRKYLKSHSKLTSPLYDLLKKDKEWKWSQDCESSFQILKKKLTTAPILGFPRCLFI